MLPMAMDCMTWQATFGNGVLIGLVKIIIANRPRVILKDQVRAIAVFCGVVLGAAVRSACVQLAASSGILRVPSPSTVFVVCQDFRTADRRSVYPFINQ